MILATRISVFAAVFWLLAPRVMRIVDGRPIALDALVEIEEVAVRG